MFRRILKRLLTGPSTPQRASQPPTHTRDEERSDDGLSDFDEGVARALIDDGALVVDVRTAAEFGGGHVPGALNVPVHDLEARPDQLDAMLDGGARAVVVYCASGMRSARAKALLQAHGLERVVNLGGVGEWSGPLE